MISASKAGVMVGGDAVDLATEYYAITNALLKKAPIIVLAVEAATSLEALKAMDKVDDKALAVLTEGLNLVKIKEVDK